MTRGLMSLTFGGGGEGEDRIQVLAAEQLAEDFSPQ